MKENRNFTAANFFKEKESILAVKNSFYDIRRDLLALT